MTFPLNHQLTLILLLHIKTSLYKDADIYEMFAWSREFLTGLREHTVVYTVLSDHSLVLDCSQDTYYQYIGYYWRVSRLYLTLLSILPLYGIPQATGMMLIPVPGV